MSKVITIAKTPSLKASTRFLFIGVLLRFSCRLPRGQRRAHFTVAVVNPPHARLPSVSWPSLRCSRTEKEVAVSEVDDRIWLVGRSVALWECDRQMIVPVNGRTDYGPLLGIEQASAR